MNDAKPICIDLFCGLGGWSEAFLAEGYECRGYDIEAHEYGEHKYPGTLILRDARSIHGSEFADAAIIVASPPCQAYSYRAMPWSRAKALPPPDNTLFNECFRIQREASEAAGRYIPMVVENVRGAQKWVGQARWHYGSFYLWGDVPALMPMTFKATKAGMKNPNGGSWDRSRPSHTTDHSWDSGQKENPDGTAHPPGSWFKIADSKNRGLKTQGHANIRDGHTHTRHLTNPHESEILRKVDEAGVKGGGDWFGSGEDCSLQRRFSGTKQSGISGPRDNGKGDKWFQDGAAQHGSRSRSRSRKAASAMIAKIPYPLAQHIARTYYPKPSLAAAG